CTCSSSSVVRSATSASAGPAIRAPRSASSPPTSCASWPAAMSIPLTFEPNSRSAVRTSTRAIPGRPPLLRAQAAELVARRLRPPPHLRHLDAPGALLAQRHLPLDPGVVEQL